ncbi:hypothetical protein [Carboxylicivirga sp. RSCT41]|uniref:hypothetical protein n=1 Tax=Carboxylicivirga agarovorans TaxID=3417570 RepID=UPI003D3438EF
MSETIILSKEGIGVLSKRFEGNEHFESIALPRLIFINAVRQQLSAHHDLLWNVKFSLVNRSENCVSISLVDDRKKFHFFYVIPLSLRLNVHLFLGDNTFNFFEAHPVLLDKGVFKDGEYPVEATMNTLPHLILNGHSDKFEMGVLHQKVLSGDDVKQSSLYRLLSQAFERFNPALFDIINGTHQL